VNDVTPAPECWLPVPDFEGFYEISDLGRIRSLDRMVPTRGAGMRLSPGRILKGGTHHRTGHKHVILSAEGRRLASTVHRLVMLAFVGPRPAGMEIRHLNGIPDDNRLINLAYGTAAENAADRDDVHGRNFESNKTHCGTCGKPYDEANTYIVPGYGWRQCKNCRATYPARRKQSEQMQRAG